ncbi:MAG: 30S ribosomal protein S4 [Candidatus Fraserbacteria bacterium RBG_16_55_9]|uniref:Small ribosomal subunit protein uS4 n=1 Tax=Fraserbacteria sp. (strain RBG_16_55_9) TaxID=1817864 RepID=A0A1F5UPE3_FRAXR|nr:MAG: 30S ribosomal protein S4 [Candidatus Fraserbacteria bacterium RBG_16_55_9]
MGMYIGPKCRLCRRERQKLFLKGQKCMTEKCPVSRRDYPPGMHRDSRYRMSRYAIQLREKQKLKRIYGMRERQFRRYVDLAKKVKGITGDYLLELLERRLDSMLYRGGLASSRDQARQLINHGHVWVNQRRVSIASYLTRPGDVIAFKESARGKKGIQAAVGESDQRSTSSWLERQNGQLRVLDKPKLDELHQDLEMSLIVEFYSR